MKKLIVIVGPTGVGKTDAAIEMAQRLGAAESASGAGGAADGTSGAGGAVSGAPLPILSADSRQFFRGMAIGTAQPTAEQLQAAPHHFIACADPTEHYSCARYADEAQKLLAELFKTHDTVIAVGGSGLYVDALCGGVDPMPDYDPELRERLSAMPLEELLAQLKQLDPAYLEQVDRRNPRRVLRGVEVSLLAGRPYSELRTTPRLSNNAARGYEVEKIVLTMPRDELYARIDRRVDAMMAAGLEAEARALLPLRHCNALQTVGYRELFDYFDGKISLDEAVDLIKRNSRRYAKRQITWFRGFARVVTF